MLLPSVPITSNVPGLILLVLIIAVPLAFLASITILSLYRRAVVRGMQTHARTTGDRSESAQDVMPPPEPAMNPLKISIVDSSSGAGSQQSPVGLYADLLQGPRRIAAIYAAAGLCYAFVTTLIFLRATNSPFSLLSFLIILWYYAWPVAVTIALVAASTWQTRLIVFGTYVLIIVILGALAFFSNNVFTWLLILLLWLLTNFPAAVLLLAFLNRRVQAVGPLALTFMIFAATGLVLPVHFITVDSPVADPLIRIGLALGLGDFAFLVLPLLGFALFGAIGWLVLEGIGNWYRRKKISEQSITIDAIWLLFGIFQSIGLLFAGEFWFVASLLSFAVYKIVARSGFRLARRGGPTVEMPPSLLILRVFSLGKRSERLFDVLAMHWRFAGSIRLIAGPDLATTTMEPHEFLEFLSGKLARRFIDSAETLDLRIAEMDLQPDPDGQFRINDFFCYEDTWKMVLSRLVRTSDAVIMDLRGFSSRNAGCIFEINELVDLVPLGRVVFIVDRSTDEVFLREVMEQSWDQMKLESPNRQSTAGIPVLYRLNEFGAAELRVLLRLLATAAQSGSETRVLTPASISGLKSSS